MHVDSQATHATSVHTSPRWAINLAGTRTKSKIMAEHQAHQHAQAAVPSSDGTTVTAVMTQPVQVPPPQTIQINETIEIGGWMNTQVVGSIHQQQECHSHKPTLL